MTKTLTGYDALVYVKVSWHLMRYLDSQELNDT